VTQGGKLEVGEERADITGQPYGHVAYGWNDLEGLLT
jgi:hypothetical protein